MDRILDEYVQSPAGIILCLLLSVTLNMVKKVFMNSADKVFLLFNVSLNMQH